MSVYREHIHYLAEQIKTLILVWICRKIPCIAKLCQRHKLLVLSIVLLEALLSVKMHDILWSLEVILNGIYEQLSIVVCKSGYILPEHSLYSRKEIHILAYSACRLDNKTVSVNLIKLHGGVEFACKSHMPYTDTIKCYKSRLISQ